MSDFSTFSQMTYEGVRSVPRSIPTQHMEVTYRNAIGVFLANAFGFCLALLEGMLVLELGTHIGGCRWSLRIESVIENICRGRDVERCSSVG